MHLVTNLVFSFAFFDSVSTTWWLGKTRDLSSNISALLQRLFTSFCKLVLLSNTVSVRQCPYKLVPGNFEWCSSCDRTASPQKLGPRRLTQMFVHPLITSVFFARLSGKSLGCELLPSFPKGTSAFLKKSFSFRSAFFLRGSVGLRLYTSFPWSFECCKHWSVEP